MKKFLSLLCAILLIVQFCVTVAVAQTESIEVAFMMEDATGNPGEKVIVELNMESYSNWNSLAVTGISYDAEVMSFVGFENYDALENEALFAAFDNEKGVITVGFMSPVNYDGKIADLVFTVNENAKAGAVSSVNIQALVKLGSDKLGTVCSSGFVTVFGPSDCEHERKIEFSAERADCLTSGYHKHFICESCGMVLKADGITQTTLEAEMIPALGHDLSEATCTASETCKICGVTFPGSSLGHSFTDYKSNNDATCTEDGTKTAKCDRCDVTDTVADAGSAKGHSFVNDACSVCGYEKAHTHNMTKTEGKAATCTEAGNVEYFACSGCGKFFADDKGEEEIVDVVLPALGHSFANYKSNNDATCTADGTKTAKCDRCDVTDTVADAGSAKGHSFVGDICTVCGFAQEHVHSMTKTEAVEATCHQNGNQEYWYCADCDSVFADAEGRYLTNRKNVIIPATKGLTYVPAAEGCHVPGTAEYWYCVECEAVFADAAGTVLTNRKNLETAPTCELVHMDAVDPCHNNGTLEHWFCPKCEAVFADAEGKQLTNRMNLTVPAIEGALQHFEAVAATKDKDGIQEHWYCEGCDCYFTDAEGKYNVAYKSLIIPAIETPQTGDPIMIWAILIVASAMGVVCTVALGKRKFFA